MHLWTDQMDADIELNISFRFLALSEELVSEAKLSLKVSLVLSLQFKSINVVALNHHLGKSNPNNLINKDKKQFAVLAPQHLANNF